MKALEQNEHDAVSGGLEPFFLRIPRGYRRPVEPPTSAAFIADSPQDW